MSASISISLALSMASPQKPLENRPLVWKPRHSARNPTSAPMARDALMIFDGMGRKPAEWDAFRKDPELWFPDADCSVHLYEYGQSRRGPAFKVPLSSLRKANCQPLLDRFMVPVEDSSPSLESNNTKASNYSNQDAAKQYELYIPVPKSLERGQIFLYHMATRNFFAWIFNRPLIGHHLGGMLVALLNSMNEFRDHSEDNVQAIMDFMDEQGYGDMRNRPDHALGILFFAEHFQFRDLWVDAFAHTVGMSQQIGASPGNQFISNSSHLLIRRAQIEMDIRLDNCGRRLRTFLSDDLLEAGLSPKAHAHLDKFRTFLHSYFVGKLGYYPPKASLKSSAFPPIIYEQMCFEFLRLYEFLMDARFTASDTILPAGADEICVGKLLRAFDKRHKYESLPHPLPLLPEDVEIAKPKLSIFGFQKSHKLKPNPRLLIFESLSKATNRQEHLLECPLVRAYQGFEKECAFSSSPLFVDKDEKLSQKEARKIRWVLIYSILQTLLSATRIPEQVTDAHDLPYSICVQTTDCPPWKEQSPDEGFVSKNPEPKSASSESIISNVEAESEPCLIPEIKFDSEDSNLEHNSQAIEIPSQPPLIPETPAKIASNVSQGTTYSPRHSRSSWKLFPEIPVKGYGNTTNILNNSSRPTTPTRKRISHARKISVESGSSSVKDSSFRWSGLSMDGVDTCSPSTSVAADSRRSSQTSEETPKEEVKICPDDDSGFFDLERVPDSLWLEAVDESCAWEPEPVELNNISKGNQFMQVITELDVACEV